MSKEAVTKDVPQYNTNLRADMVTEVNEKPKARVHSVEWRKVMSGDPVEINPSVGHGYKIMTVDEWSARWKRNDDFPECLNCGGSNTKEHHFMQVWSTPSSGPRKWCSRSFVANRASISSMLSDRQLVAVSLFVYK